MNRDNKTTNGNDSITDDRQWVLVTKHKPTACQWLIVHAATGMHIAWFNGFQFEDKDDYNITDVTHWIPLPTPPCT